MKNVNQSVTSQPFQSMSQHEANLRGEELLAERFDWVVWGNDKPES